jgi:phosphoribosylamine--glycine ligase
VQKVYVAPGNAGTAREHGWKTWITDDIEACRRLAREKVRCHRGRPRGAAGRRHRRRAFRAPACASSARPRAAAQLESSKDFAKRFMTRHKIPTAKYQTFTDIARRTPMSTPRARRSSSRPTAWPPARAWWCRDGRAEAHAAVDMMLADNKLGDAGARVVIEEFLDGEEASFIVMADGRHVLALATSQDHKRCKDGDQGPNTGGMGAYSPAPVVTPEIHARVMREVIMPTINGMAADGIALHRLPLCRPDDQARRQLRVLEFNCRMGDPETQPIMMRLKSDLRRAGRCRHRRPLDQVEAEWDRRVALGVVMAAAGYPDAAQGRRDPRSAARTEDSHVFHAGTAEKDGEVVTAGGRVLCVTALGDNVKAAQKRAYEVLDQIGFDGMQCRRDIGYRAIKR